MRVGQVVRMNVHFQPMLFTFTPHTLLKPTQGKQTEINLVVIKSNHGVLYGLARIPQIR